MSRSRFASKVLMLAAVLLLPAAMLRAQEQTATTQDGRTVVLRADGTWAYVPKAPAPAASGANSVFTRPQHAQKAYAGKRVGYTLWVDDSAWKLDPDPNNADAEYMLNHVEGDGIAMIIPERTYIPLDRLVDVAVDNFREAASDVRVLEREVVSVNGVEVVRVRMNGIIGGYLAASYCGYYYAAPEFGAIQIVTLTSQNLFDEYRTDFEDLLNGFTVTPITSAGSAE